MTTSGFYATIAPIVAVPVEDTHGLTGAFIEIITRGNPLVPAPDFSKKDDSRDVCHYAGVKDWPTFMRGTTTWAIDDDSGFYQIKIGRRIGPGRGWKDDPDLGIALPPETTIAQLCARVVEIIQEKARQ